MPNEMPPCLGENLRDPLRRAAWQELVERLHEFSQEGGPLHGYAFHGTDIEAARWIAEEGVQAGACHAQVVSDGPWLATEGTHWATARVAAFYAEDRIEATENPELGIAIVAARIDDIAECGALAVDGQTLDMPVDTRLRLGEDGVWPAWEASVQDWRACWEIMETLLVLGSVPAEKVSVIADLEDVERLLAKVSSPAP